MASRRIKRMFGQGAIFAAGKEVATVNYVVDIVQEMIVTRSLGAPDEVLEGQQRINVSVVPVRGVMPFLDEDVKLRLSATDGGGSIAIAVDGDPRRPRVRALGGIE